VRLSIEFEMQSEPGDDDAGVSVYSILVSTFRGIGKFRIVPVRTYVGDVHPDQPIFWREIHPSQQSSQVGSARTP
jgi:hypothetical protein